MESSYRQILDTTIELMNKKGYHGTSIQMIADKVGASKSTIFYHFKNKEGILLAILEDFVPSATSKFMQIVKNQDLSGVEKLREFIKMHLDQVAKAGDVLNLYLRESRFISGNNSAIYKEAQRTYAHLLVDVIRQIQKEDKRAFRNLDPNIAAHSILGMCNSAVIWFKKTGDLDIQDLAKQMYEMLSGSFSIQIPLQ